MGADEVEVTHLFFADGTLLFCKPNSEVILHIKCVLL